MDQTDIHPTGALLVQEICKTMSDLKLVKEWVTKSPKVCLFTFQVPGMPKGSQSELTEDTGVLGVHEHPYKLGG